MTVNNSSKPFGYKWIDYIASIPTQNKSRSKNFKQKKIDGMTLSSHAKHVAMALGTYCRDDKNSCYPNVSKHLMQGHGLTLNIYKQGIAELEHKGLVEVMKSQQGMVINGKKIRWGSNLYVLTIK